MGVNYAVADPVELGIWSDQIHELMSEFDYHWNNGDPLAIIHQLDLIRRWIPQSPCPNVVAFAYEYGKVALELIALGPGLDFDTANKRPFSEPLDPEARKDFAAEFWKAKGGKSDEQIMRDAVRAAEFDRKYIPAGKTRRNWLGDPVKGCE